MPTQLIPSSLATHSPMACPLSSSNLPSPISISTALSLFLLQPLISLIILKHKRHMWASAPLHWLPFSLGKFFSRIRMTGFLIFSSDYSILSISLPSALCILLILHYFLSSHLALKRLKITYLLYLLSALPHKNIKL